MDGFEPKVRESGAQNAVDSCGILNAIEPIEEVAHFRADREGRRSLVMHDFSTGEAADNSHGISARAEGPRFDLEQARPASREERRLPTDEPLFAQVALPIG